MKRDHQPNDDVTRYSLHFKQASKRGPTQFDIADDLVEYFQQKGRMRSEFSLKVILLAVAVILIGCDNEVTSPAATATGEEPTGGQWTPILLSSGSSIRLPAPPAPGSAVVLQELQYLRARQANRTVQIMDSVQFWDRGAALRWNEIARTLVIRRRMNPPMASRAYALLSVAQYDALVAAWNNKYYYNRPTPDRVDQTIEPIISTNGTPAYPSEHATVAASSAAVLVYLFPLDADSLAMLVTRHKESRLWAGVSYPSDIAAGDSLGRLVAQTVIAYASNDGSGALWTGTIPIGAGYWYSSANPPQPPLLPLWGSVRPWLMMSGSQFRPAPPPVFGSSEFNTALAEVRAISDTRTAEQLHIAQFWADGAGTYTPPGHWNDIACTIIATRRVNELRTARALGLMNMAIMDAGISCWEAKYTYWLLRPSQADGAITLPIGLPNFPSYTSGHSTFSGAAAEVLGYLFPDLRSSMRAMADEAGISRLYGGIHYRFDSEAGLIAGRGIAQLAIQRGNRDGSPR